MCNSVNVGLSLRNDEKGFLDCKQRFIAFSCSMHFFYFFLRFNLTVYNDCLAVLVVKHFF
jgi:hypothetical protein